MMQANSSLANDPNELSDAGITRLRLTNFRNHQYLALDLDSRPVVITGPNGAGKTNILEAISYFSPGRGLRSAKLSEVTRFIPKELDAGSHFPQSIGIAQHGWAVSAKLQTAYGVSDFGTAYENGINQSDKRVIKINQDLSSQTALAEQMSMLWITPQMDRIFVDGVSARRKFLDRLVYSFDPAHAARVLRYEHVMRERLKLLKTSGTRHGDWLSALETKMVESAASIAAARLQTLETLEEARDWSLGLFPRARLSLKGTLEESLVLKSALEAEDGFKTLLASSRQADAESGRTTFGPHRSEFLVLYEDKLQPAEHCSTGEQKALLISIIMTAMRLHAIRGDRTPILLLDEVVAHLDEKRRAAVLEEICALKIQAWMTGTEDQAFVPLKERAQHFKIVEGVIKPL